MNLMCRIFGHSYNWCSGIVYCARCSHIPESHKKYTQIPVPNKNNKIIMSKNNQMIMIQPPMFLGDGNRQEKIEAKGHRCPSCSGNGWNWGQDEWRERLKVECPVCKGKGSLDAKIIIEWGPAK